jgi:transcriptional regulator with XRE-family HTH domain
LASPDEIKIRMLQRQLTQDKIAASLNVTRNAISQVINGKLKTPRLRAAVTAALGWPASRLWADAGKAPREQQGKGQEAQQGRVAW